MCRHTVTMAAWLAAVSGDKSQRSSAEPGQAVGAHQSAVTRLMTDQFTEAVGLPARAFACRGRYAEMGFLFVAGCC